MIDDKKSDGIDQSPKSDKDKIEKNLMKDIILEKKTK